MRELLDNFRRLLTPSDKWRLVFLVTLMAVGALMEIVGIGLLLPIVAAVTDPELLETNRTLHAFRMIFCELGENGFLLATTLLAVALYAGKNLLTFFIVRLQSRFVFTKERELAERLFRTFLNAPYSFHLAHGAPELETLMSRSGLICREVMMPAMAIATDALTVALLAAMLMCAMPLLMMSSIGFLLVCGLAVYLPLRFYNQRCGTNEAENDCRCRTVWLHSFLGIKTVKAADAGEHFAAEFAEHRKAVGVWRAIRYQLGQLPRLLLETAAIVLVLGIFMAMVLRDVAKPEILMVFSVLVATMSRILPAFSRIHYNLALIRQNRTISNSVFEALDIAPEAMGTPGNGEALHFTTAITVTDLNFTYPDGRRIFQNFSMEIPHLASLAVTGPTGSGKTTLVDLLLGLLKPNSGDIMVDGHSIFSDLRSWRRRCAYVPQNIYLLDDTVAANIAFGEPPEAIDRSRVREALKLAQLDDFTASLPRGDDTVIGENGVRLSGGQRQRLGIARALYRKPELLILDEATSALDVDTEAALIGALETLYGKLTIVMIAHRLSTVEKCDRRIEITGCRVVPVTRR